MNSASIAKTLQSKGQAMVLTRVTGGVFDPVAGSVSGATTQNFTVYGITSNYSSITRIASANQPNSMILGGDKKAIISAGVVVPVPGDTLTIMGKVWTVIAVDALAPQGTDLLYTCQVRL